MVALTMFVAPALRLGTLFLVLGGLRLRRPPRWLPQLYRWAALLGPWAMIEVYMLGVFVAYVKLMDLATVAIGPGPLFGRRPDAGDHRRRHQPGHRDGVAGVRAARPDPDRRRRLIPAAPPASATPAAWSRTCRPADMASCPRCGAALHRRRPDSLTRTWALVVTAIILYIPANLLPVMTVISLGSGAPDTIMSGVIELADAGMWPLAALVFFASITVPVLKLIGLIILLVSTQRGATRRLRDRTVLYRIVEAVGRWSMIDIFMISILVALVQLGELATIEPGIGAVSFAAVVIITMIAAMSFDPRLMWDAAGENHD